MKITRSDLLTPHPEPLRVGTPGSSLDDYCAAPIKACTEGNTNELNETKRFCVVGGPVSIFPSAFCISKCLRSISIVINLRLSLLPVQFQFEGPACAKYTGNDGIRDFSTLMEWQERWENGANDNIPRETE